MTLGQWLIGIKDKITDLASRVTSLEVDYIVEEGTSGIWTYRKWSSGLSECWTTNIVSSGTHTMTQNGALYQSDPHNYDFPANLFTDRPKLSVNVQQGGGMWAKATGSTTALTAQIGFLRTNDNTESINFNMEAKGSWIQGDLRLLGTENEEPISSENGLMLSLGGASTEAIPISDLPTVSSLTGATIFPVVLDGTTYNTTLSVILNHTHTKSQITDFPAIPTKTSDLTNDSGFITQNNVDDVKVDGTSVLTNRIANINLSGKADTTYVNSEIAKKLDSYNLSITTGGGGSFPIKFIEVDYNSTTSETGVLIKVGMVSAHGNGQSYRFLQDAILAVDTLGNVAINVFKYYGADTTIDGQPRLFGDVFYTKNTTTKKVTFYCIAGQYGVVRMQPYMRLNNSNGGTITQFTGGAYTDVSGTKVWGNNLIIAVTSQLPTSLSQLTNDSGFVSVGTDGYLRNGSAAIGSNGYIEGTWAKLSGTGDLGYAPPMYPVFRDDGWIYYRTAAETKTDLGIIGVPFYSGDASTAEHNANAITSNGHYYYNANGPSGLGENFTDGALYTQSYNANWVGQIAQDYRDGDLFVRGKNSGNWTAWRAIPSSADGHSVDLGSAFTLNYDASEQCVKFVFK